MMILSSLAATAQVKVGGTGTPSIYTVFELNGGVNIAVIKLVGTSRSNLPYLLFRLQGHNHSTPT